MATEKKKVADKSISLRLKEIIKDGKYSVAWLARKINLDRKTIDNWLNGSTYPSSHHIFALYELFNVSPNWLLFGIGEKYLDERFCINESAFSRRLDQTIIKSEYKNVSRLSRKMDLDRKTIDKWAKGETRPHAGSLVLLCKILQVSANWLLLGKGERDMFFESAQEPET